MLLDFYLVFLWIHLELVDFLQFWNLECSMRITAFNLKIVNLSFSLLHLSLHHKLFFEHSTGLFIQFHAQSCQIIWNPKKRVETIQLMLQHKYLPLFMEEISGRGPTLSLMESGTTMMMGRWKCETTMKALTELKHVSPEQHKVTRSCWSTHNIQNQRKQGATIRTICCCHVLHEYCVELFFPNQIIDP